jgi:hypothetical protein
MSTDVQFITHHIADECVEQLLALLFSDEFADKAVAR